MKKSYVESDSTALSMNQDDIGSKKVEQGKCTDSCCPPHPEVWMKKLANHHHKKHWPEEVEKVHDDGLTRTVFDYYEKKHGQRTVSEVHDDEFGDMIWDLD